MNPRTIRLAAGNIRNIAAEQLYLKTGIFLAKPIQIYAIINTKCNARCRMCTCWRNNSDDELPASIWIRALKELKELSSTFNVSFSGGEPLMKKDLYEILEFCKEQNITFGVTTNGLLLNEKNVQRLLNCNVFNINISIDSMIDEIHDSIRGVPGCLAKVKKNVEYLVEQKRKTGSRVSIMMKPVVCSENLPDLQKLAEYAKDIGIAGVQFQPIFEWSEESKQMTNVDPGLLKDMIDRLIEMKAEGYPILNSELTIRQWTDHFTGKLPERTSPCVVGLRSLTIKQDGEVVLCGVCNAYIGNIKDSSVGDLWYGEKTKKIRAALVKCDRLCLASCVVKRRFRDYVDLFRRLGR